MPRAPEIVTAREARNRIRRARFGLLVFAPVLIALAVVRATVVSVEASVFVTCAAILAIVALRGIQLYQLRDVPDDEPVENPIVSNRSEDVTAKNVIALVAAGIGVCVLIAGIVYLGYLASANLN